MIKFLIKLIVTTMITIWLLAQCTGQVVSSLKDCTFNNEQPGCENYYKGYM